MKLVDVADSKSAAGNSVPVRVRSPAPKKQDPMRGPAFLLLVGDRTRTGGSTPARRRACRSATAPSGRLLARRRRSPAPFSSYAESASGDGLAKRVLVPEGRRVRSPQRPEAPKGDLWFDTRPQAGVSERNRPIGAALSAEASVSPDKLHSPQTKKIHESMMHSHRSFAIIVLSQQDNSTTPNRKG